MMRRFAVLLPGLLLVLLLAACTQSTEPLVVEDYLLGTVIRISIHDDGYDTSLTDRVFERVATIERRMSTSEDDYDDTELLTVNRAPAGTATPVSADTFEVLSAALDYSRVSDGAFDVTIWPLVKLWGIGSGGETVPPEGEITAARELVDYHDLTLNADGTVTLAREGMGVDVGAIAKGYAADEAERILRDAGVTSALLDFGGNILVIGSKPDDSPWRIGIQRPDAERSRYIGIVHTADRTVVTSGPYERFFVEDGVRYHHILNPDTGYPSRNGLVQVTIVAERSIDADALSTTSYVLGLTGAYDLIESIKGVEAVFATEERELFLTPGLQESDESPQNTTETHFELTDDEYQVREITAVTDR
ncbi:MAG: FAD:protein FMN transferase [Spirochaeta sp.]|nr:FAD:protein FMN transferase [Spirochaeta sp.]